jgi:hypothetical protein
MLGTLSRVGGILAVLLVLCAASVRAEGAGGTSDRIPTQRLTVPMDVALASLMYLSDGYLRSVADAFAALAACDEARTAEWEVIRPPLAVVADANADIVALVWFALPDGSYWSVEEGKAAGNLSTREYFPRVLAGETVIGPLVISNATGKASAIVAVPVRAQTGEVVGVLGASVDLAKLSALLNEQMALRDGMIFYSFDAEPLVALNWDPTLVFLDPFSLGPEIRAAFEEMLSHDQGVVRYTFRGQVRTVVYRRSPVTGWWYAFGLVGPGASGASSRPR